jgi:carbamoyltransferase
MFTLGINAVFHDSAAVIIEDGCLLAAAEEERFTHIKHGKRPVPFSSYEMPYHAVDYCLRTAGIHLSEVDHIAYSFDPELLGLPVVGDAIPLPLKAGKGDALAPESWDPLFYCYIRNAPAQLVDGYPHHLEKRFSGAKTTDFQWHYVDHHLAHAASAFLPSPFPEAAVMVLDGRGELATTTYYDGSGNHLEKLGEVQLPHSLGLLYEKITTYLGFLHSSDEYKVMALASYGKPVFAPQFRSLLQLRSGGTYRIASFSPEALFGPARQRGTPFTEHHFHIARSLQQVLQESVLELAQWFRNRTGRKYLCLAGGVALNCVLNGVLRDSGLFGQIWVQPAAGDAGTALGAAMWTDIRERKSEKRDFIMDHVYWGPAFGDEEVEKFLKWSRLSYRKADDIAAEAAALLAEDKVIGWFQGRMEFGPRALGSRSILASPIHAGMQARLNEIKDREDFRPVAPVVLEEEAADWFEQGASSPFMLFVYPARKDRIHRIPAVTHVDGTARIQTVNEKQHPCYYRLLKEFKKITGVPVLINTSFNTRGEPIVCTPRDAVESFWTSPLDALLINSFILEKPDLPKAGERSRLKKEVYV